MEDVPFHLSKSVASIACYPQGYCDPSIPIALLSLGLPADRFVRYVHRENPVDCAYNKAVKEALAKPSWKDIEWFVFGDNDMQLTSMNKTARGASRTPSTPGYGGAGGMSLSGSDRPGSRRS